MRMTLTARFMLAAWLLPVAAGAASSPSKALEALAVEVAQLAELDQIAAQFPQQLRAQAESGRPLARMPAHEQRRLRVIVDAYDAERAGQVLRDHFARHGNRSDLKRVRDWLASELGKKITAEELAGNRVAPKDLAAFAQQVERDPAARERLRRVRDIESAGRMVALNIALLREVLVALAQANAPAGAGARSLDAAAQQQALRTQVNNVIAMARPDIERQVLLSAHYSYRRLADAELAEYARFLGSGAGRRYVALMTDAVSAAQQDYLTRAVAAVASQP